MFATRFFPLRMFLRRYWPRPTADVGPVQPAPILTFYGQYQPSMSLKASHDGPVTIAGSYSPTLPLKGAI